ncbi:MAG TPA: hypothetical protein VK302_01300 [Terriglobales bacterium]|nr:hypothetical protein [Terriglobales bacterium]
MRRRQGLLRYIEIAVLTLLGIPAGVVIMMLGFAFHFPTPGVYVFWLFPVTETRDWVFLSMPRLVAAGLVNAICCYLLIRGLAAVVAALRRQKGPAAPSGRRI